VLRLAGGRSSYEGCNVPDAEEGRCGREGEGDLCGGLRGEPLIWFMGVARTKIKINEGLQDAFPPLFEGKHARL